MIFEKIYQTKNKACFCLTMFLAKITHRKSRLSEIDQSLKGTRNPRDFAIFSQTPSFLLYGENSF